MKPAIPSEKFFHASPIATYVLLDMVCREPEFDKVWELGVDAVDWFKAHADLRIRFMYANNRRWKAVLRGERKRTDPRDFCKAFIRHWLKGYMLNPQRYAERHPHSIFQSPAPRKAKQTA